MKIISWNGLADILLPYDEEKVGAIYELKYAKDITQLERGCDRALQQIEKKQYADALLKNGCKRVMKYEICFIGRTAGINA